MRITASLVRGALGALPLLVTLLLACGETPTQVLDLQVRGDAETKSLPELPPPFASEEIEAMVETFDWAETDALSVLDEDGRPALHYALVLLRDRSELEELGTHEVHHDALPLFEVEHERWDGQTGMHAFPGSEVGDFAFALLPAELFNLYRQAALDGEPIFHAVILREVPVPEARMPGGSVDYDWLGAQGFVYGGATDAEERFEELSDSTTHELGVGRHEAALAGRVVRAARRLARGIINGVRRAASEVRKGLGGSRPFGLRLFVHETDDDFDLGPDAQMRQAWLGENAGQPVRVKGVEVLVASGAMISLDRGTTDRHGYVHFRVPNARRIRVHLRMKNAAADLIGLLWDKRITVFHGGVDRNAPVHIDAHVQDADMNVLAQLTSARDFVHHALDYESPRRLRSHLPVFTRNMPTALVRTGLISRIAPNAFAPCLGFYGFGSLSFGGGRGWSVAANAFSILDEADIWLPEGGARVSRVVPTHEYGHFVMCAFLADNGRRAFGRAYSEVWQDSLSGDEAHDGQAGILAEGWADFLSSQIAGGYGYFWFDAGDTKDTNGEYGDSYCQPRDASMEPCLEDNVGGPPGGFPRGQRLPSGVLAPRDEEIARIATLFTDAFDGGGELHNGAVWSMTRDLVSNDIVDIDWVHGGHADDETIILRGAALHAIVADWARTSNHLRYGSFLRAMARTMWLEGEDPDEICELFALHSPSGQCTDLIPQIAGPYAPSTPTSFVAGVLHASAADRPTAVLTWEDVSYAATGFRVTGRIADDPSFAVDLELPYARLALHSVPEVPFNRALRFELFTQNETVESAPATAETWTPAEPARGFSGAGLPGGVRLRWDAIEAQAVRIRMLAPEVLDATLPLDEATEHVVDGLAGDTDYTFELVSVNGAGELSQFPSAPVTVRTLPAPELYVAPHGDDTHPRAGTRLNPFATVAAALRTSDASLPITLRLAAGTYREAALRITDRTVTIEGGYDASWVRGGGPSVLNVGLSGDLEPLSATRFNTARRRTRAAIQAERTTLTLDAVELVVSDASATSCVTALWARASDVRLRDSTVTGARSGPCRVAISAHEGQLSLLDSTLSATSTVPSSASEHVALFTRATAEVTVADSELFGIDARTTGSFTTSVRGALGWIDQGTGQLRMTRSQASAATGFAASPLTADVVGALDLTGVGSVFVDNSVLQTPGGARAADVVRVAGAESVRIYHSTAVLGHEFAPTTRRTSGRSSVIRLEGRVRSFALYNDLLAYADWSAATPYSAVLDLAGLDRVALLASSVRGNVFSYPPADRVTAGLGGGPLVMCGFLGEEFSVMALSETQLNQASHYTCRTGGTVVASNNVALLANPGTSPASRSGVVLEESGDVAQTGSPSTHPTVADVLRTGAILSASFPWAEVSRDRIGVMRSGPARPGVGAFVIP